MPPRRLNLRDRKRTRCSLRLPISNDFRIDFAVAEGATITFLPYQSRLIHSARLPESVVGLRPQGLSQGNFCRILPSKRSLRYFHTTAHSSGNVMGMSVLGREVGATALATMPNEKETVGSFRYSSLWPLLEFFCISTFKYHLLYFWLFTVPRFEPTDSPVLSPACPTTSVYPQPKTTLLKAGTGDRLFK